MEGDIKARLVYRVNWEKMMEVMPASYVTDEQRREYAEATIRNVARRLSEAEPSDAVAIPDWVMLDVLGKDAAVTPADAVAYLNGLLDLDRPAIAALVANRVPCNAELADHPSCQVGTQHGGWNVGLLGLLNGLFGTIEGGKRDGWGWITAVFEDEAAANGRRLARFEVTDPEVRDKGGEETPDS